MLLYAVRRKYIHRKGNEGFTLVEMLTALIIVGVLSAVAAPNLLGMLNNTRVKDGLGQVAGAVRETQKLAKREGKTCVVSLSSRVVDSNQYAIAQLPPGVAAYNGCLLETRELEREVILEFDNDPGTLNNSLTAIDSGNLVNILFTSRGNTTDDANVDGETNGATGIIVISHPNTNVKKCLQIAGVLGNIITGDYVDTDANGTLDSCDPDITD